MAPARPRRADDTPVVPSTIGIGGMQPRFYDGKKYVQHRMEEVFNARGWDILSAIERGFRAQVDVKGKLAEFFLHRELVVLQEQGVITSVEWNDQDGKPDFCVDVKGRKIHVECKNVRSGKEVFPDAFKVEIQKTRNSIGGGPSRGYKADEFDILAACLFNQTREWKYLFSTTINLERRAEWPDFLVIMQRVPYEAEGNWRNSLEEAIADLG